MTVERAKQYAVQLMNAGPAGGAITAALISRITGNEMATIFPPFGLVLFVMKGVVPSETTVGDIYKVSIPFLVRDAVATGLVIAFPVASPYLGT